MSKNCAKVVETNREKAVYDHPQFPLSPTITRLRSKVCRSLHNIVPIIHTGFSHILHSHVDKNSRGMSTVFPLLHTPYYYYY